MKDQEKRNSNNNRTALNKNTRTKILIFSRLDELEKLAKMGPKKAPVYFTVIGWERREQNDRQQQSN